MIRKGQHVRICPEWQDPGDDDYTWIALEDEGGGRALVQPQIPGMRILPTQRVNVGMVEALRRPNGHWARIGKQP
jgi:hypothetical protein